MKTGAIENREGFNEKNNIRAEGKRLINEKIFELSEKIKSGNTEETYTIGASSFTKKQWEKLMTEFDMAQNNIKDNLKFREETYKDEKKDIK